MAKVHDIVIIGGGPAGLAAAVYAARANFNPLVLAGSPPGGQLTLTSEVENYPGYEAILGAELIEKMRAQAQKFGAEILNENVLKVDFSQAPYKLYVGESALKKLYPEAPQEAILAKSVIVATGAKALWLGLESEQRLRGKGVSACATCDGFFFRNKTVAVVGGGDTAMEEAITLTKFAQKVYVVHRRDSFKASKIMQDRVLHHEKIEVLWNSSIKEVLGEMKVEGVRLDKAGKEEELKLDGVFLAIGHKPDTDLFKDQLELDEKGYLLTSEVVALRQAQGQKATNIYDYSYHTMTSKPGIFGAGDNVDHVYRQAATAAGMGVAAALDVERWIDGQETEKNW